MSVQHASGPWRVDGPPENQIVWRDGENRVCFLAHSNGRDPERDLATGRLIAEAPDMLVTLRDAYTVLAFAFQRIHSLPRSRDSELAAHIGKVRARIETVFAKVEGRL